MTNMNSVQDIVKIVSAVESLRERARSGANYNDIIQEYERILKFSLRVSNGVEEKMARKFQELRRNMQEDVRQLVLINKELGEIAQGCVQHEHPELSSNEAKRDPDVWPPPTPQPKSNLQEERRAAASNVPSWAKGREEANYMQPKRLPVRTPQVSRPNVSEEARLERMRKEQSSAVPGGRQRVSNSPQAPATAGGAGPSGQPPGPSAALKQRAEARANRPALNQRALNNKPDAKQAGSNKGKKDAANGEGELIKYSVLMSGHPDVRLIEEAESNILPGKAGVSWDNIAGLKEAKELLYEAAVMPLWMPDFFTGILRPWKGILMFGPPGTGKTMLAKAVSTECETTFFGVSATTFSNKYHGESEKMVKYLFQVARYYAPSTIFFDEVDALAGTRGAANEHEASRKVKTQLMVEMDGITPEAEEKGGEKEFDEDGNEIKPKKKIVIIMGATNCPWDLDDAIRRRFEKRIYIPLPDLECRINLFEITLKDRPVDEDVLWTDLAERSNGYSCADIVTVCREAAMTAVRLKMAEVSRMKKSKEEVQALLKALQSEQNSIPISLKSFLDALAKVNRSVGDSQLNRYSEWMAEFGSS